jgi:hypothetical protein
MKKLFLLSSVLFLCAALHAKPIPSKSGTKPSQAKSAPAIEFLPHEQVDYIFDLALPWAYNYHYLCDSNGKGYEPYLSEPFRVRINKKLQHLEFLVYKGNEHVGYYDDNLYYIVSPDAPSDVDFINMSIDQGYNTFDYVAQTPLEYPYVIESAKNKVALLNPYNSIVIGGFLWDSYMFIPGNDYRAVMKIITEDGEEFTKEYPIKISYVNDTLGMFDGVGIKTAADAKKELIKKIQDNLYKAMEEVKSLDAYDLNGRKVKQGKKELSLEDLPKAVYVLKAVGKDNKTQSMKVIKE